MPLPKTVTAQDFWKAFHSQVSKMTEHYLLKSGDDVVENITAQFDALLSRARQEAKIEAQMEYIDARKQQEEDDKHADRSESARHDAEVDAKEAASNQATHE